MERLTSNHLPDLSRGLHRRLAVVMDNALITTPRLNGVVSRDGQISGQFFDDREIDLLVEILRAGRLPLLINSDAASEEWFTPP